MLRRKTKNLISLHKKGGKIVVSRLRKDEGEKIIMIPEELGRFRAAGGELTEGSRKERAGGGRKLTEGG